MEAAPPTRYTPPMLRRLLTPSRRRPARPVRLDLAKDPAAAPAPPVIDPWERPRLTEPIETGTIRTSLGRTLRVRDHEEDHV